MTTDPASPDPHHRPALPNDAQLKPDLNSGNQSLGNQSPRNEFIVQTLRNAAFEHRTETVRQLEFFYRQAPNTQPAETARQIVASITVCNEPNDFANHDCLEHWLPTLACGDASKVISSIACRAELQSAADRMKYQFRQAFVAPALLLACTIGVLLFLAIFVIPEFDAMFSEFALDLNASTQLVITFSRLINNHLLGIGFSIVIAISIMVLAIWLYQSSSHMESLRSSFRKEFSIYDQPVISAYHDMADLCDTGLGHADALQITLYRFHQRSATNLSRPTITETLRRLPNSFAQSIGIDGTAMPTRPEDRHVIATDLRAWAAIYRDRMVYRVSAGRAIVVIGYATKILIGFIIGFVILALFSPLISLIAGLT